MTDQMCDISDLNKLAELAPLFGGFGCIYVDPPWHYDNQRTKNSTERSESGYNTMSLEEIAALPIRELAGDKSHVHLWTTSAFLEDSFALLRTWGFEYKGFYCWVKPQMGMGNYYRISKEPMLLGVRGKQKFIKRDQRDWTEIGEEEPLTWDKFDRRRHSAKPPEVRKMIERVSPAPRLELFSRDVLPGWIPWGNEIKRIDFDAAVDHELAMMQALADL